MIIKYEMYIESQRTLFIQSLQKLKDDNINIFFHNEGTAVTFCIDKDDYDAQEKLAFLTPWFAYDGINIDIGELTKWDVEELQRQGCNCFDCEDYINLSFWRKERNQERWL